MASPDPIAAERAHYLSLLGLTVDDPGVTLSQLRAMTGAGVDARNAAEAKITEQKMVAGSAFVRSVNGIIPDVNGNVTVAGGGGSSDWNALINKPATFPPDAHSHPISGVTSLQAALDAKSFIGHSHSIADTMGLQGTLDNKSPVGHTHTIANITNLQSTLDSKAASAHSHGAADLTGVVKTVNGTAPDGSGNVTVSGGGGGSSSELSGTGSPEGVVTASPGIYYTDTNGTNGAWRWLKMSGTGTTGWKVIYGDTGWRTFGGSGVWPWITPSICRWRLRSGGLVEVYFSVAAGQGAGSLPAEHAIPAGARPLIEMPKIAGAAALQVQADGTLSVGATSHWDMAYVLYGCDNSASPWITTFGTSTPY